MNAAQPPRAAAWILARFAGPSIVGDYEEIYEQLQTDYGKRSAIRWYWRQVLKSMPLFAANFLFGSIAMLKNDIKMAFRNILKHKRYAFLNIFGLAVGLAACLLMAGYVLHELSFENMYPEKDRIYRINGRIPMGNRTLLNGVVCAPFGPAAEESLPEIEENVRILRRRNVPVKVGDREFKEKKMFFASQEMLDVFAIHLRMGRSDTALEAPFTVLLDERLSEKYFGDENPLGKTLRLTLQKTHEFTVTGVMRNMPSNTVLKTSMIASFATVLQTHGESAGRWESWGNITTFVRLREGVDPVGLDEKITALARPHLDEDEQDAAYYLQPLGELYLGRSRGGSMNNDLDNTGSLSRLKVFSAVALLILVIAIINFINLSTAKITGRMKEVGIRKTCGARRSHLWQQFMVESLLITSLAMGLGLILFALFKPRLDTYLGKTLSLSLLSGPLLILSIAALVLLVGFLAGSYPALFLSRFQAAVIFRSALPSGSSRTVIRKALVGVQFFIASALIVSAVVVLRQVRYSESKDLGFNHDNLVVLNNRGATGLPNPSYVKTQILNLSGASAVSSIDSFPSAQNRNIAMIRTEGESEEEAIMVQSMEVDEDFVPTMPLKIVSGRNFEPGRYADKGAVLLNRTAAAALDLADPVDQFIFRGEDSYRIIGLLDDWNTNSIHSRIFPTILFPADESARELLIRIPPGQNEAVMGKMREFMYSQLPDQIFDYAYVDDLNYRAYSKERRLALLLISFCQLAVLIACLGIFGLAAYSTEQRTKEIGIRRVLGSGVAGIVYLFSIDYIRWVMLANCVAWPAAYLFMNNWLRSFAFRSPMGLLPFVTAGLLTLAVAVLSVVFQTVKAAVVDPVHSLRYE